MTGTIWRRPAIGREPNPLVLGALRPDLRPHFERALSRELVCVYYPTFARANAEHRLRCDLPADTNAVRKLETQAFVWYNYLRWRVLCRADSMRAGALSLGACRALGEHAGAAATIRERIILANLALAPYMVRRRCPGAAESDEYTSVAMEALMRAVDSYDSLRGFKFSGYACRTISNDLLRHRGRVALHAQRVGNELDEAQATDDGQAHQQTELQVDAELVATAVWHESTGLTRAEQTVIVHRFGFAGNGSATLDRVGAMIGVSKERVRQLQLSAIEKVRSAVRVQ